ncbi:hypothetical protein C1645_833101 [Glomus cerebriforme]|uniref:Uncharacterized protein n=1 Tax=Glomus cerebriforme TaxID=658196 RepID=A0A397SIU1_9GLOM|nr:hypothetical protein C1645_833101 [Glomus cerebriforme]
MSRVNHRTIHWNPDRNDIIIGHSTNQQLNLYDSASTTTMEHWIYFHPNQIASPNTSRRLTPYIIPCPGCNLHTNEAIDKRPLCSIIYPTHLLHKIHLHPKSYTPLT